eukprot:TRINITY_DN4730_c0_g1_i1.p2 TRINITY_DN4730_c0_g1~~TRINITY_DN4730_c0_g1_i1.p2  ORF type:complete len:226 (-),score=28.14 TRINITY_DN4730_c0_g1_i1:647-1324(-)
MSETALVVGQPVDNEPIGRVRQDAKGVGGGCCVRRPMSRPERLIVPITAARCLSAGAGMNDDLRSAAPMDLKERGVTDHQWIALAQSLEDTVQSEQCPCGLLGMILGVATILPIPLVWKYTSKYQGVMEAWVSRLNTEVLEPKGMFGATQTAVWHNLNHYEEVSWLAIAMTKAEAQSLRSEPHIWNMRLACPCCAPCGCPTETTLVPGCWSSRHTLLCCGPLRTV